MSGATSTNPGGRGSVLFRNPERGNIGVVGTPRAYCRHQRSDRRATMRGHGKHMWMCAAMIGVALVLALVTGSGFYLLPVVGCMLMMGHDDVGDGRHERPKEAVT